MPPHFSCARVVRLKKNSWELTEANSGKLVFRDIVIFRFLSGFGWNLVFTAWVLSVARKIEGRGFGSMRRKAREMALRVLFEVEVGKSDLEKVLQRSVRSCNMPAVTDFAGELIHTVAKNKLEIDNIIQQYAIGWKLDRMGSVDRNILRLAIAEIAYLDDIPISASINEAIELGKLYGDEQSARFINGILGTVSKTFGKQE